jgi:hypothetical protein
LVAAGVLALGGRNHYKAWRQAQKTQVGVGRGAAPDRAGTMAANAPNGARRLPQHDGRHSPRLLLGPRPFAARLLLPTRERGPRRSRRSSDIVGVIPYRSSRQSRRQSQGVRASRNAPSGCPNDRGASVST